MYRHDTYLQILALLALLMVGQTAWATHNRAGEITYVQLDELRIQATITTWTKTSSADVDRDSLEMFWGDGVIEWIQRTGEELLPNDIKKNEYTAIHNYPGRGRYVLSVFDPNRIGGILNVNFPNSLNVPFYIQTTLTLINPILQGFNSSPMLLQPPIDFGCLGQPFLHNPNALDPDGDSLSYELIVPFQDSSVIVPNYQFPDRINAGQDNFASLDETTGTFSWDSPQRTGEYNIAIAIYEWRQGVLINTTIRDMQIFVRECDNKPPQLDIPDDICVVAGQTIEFDIAASDSDPGQLIALTVLGGPFVLDTSPAVLNAPNGYVPSPIDASFKWETQCEHISDQYYTIVFRVVDNFLDSTGLATLKVMRIKIVGPAPENLMADRGNGAIEVSWDSPYACDQVADNYFQGFTLYRRINGLDLEIDTCDPGLKNREYLPIAFNITEINNNRYVYSDTNVEKGLTYCYRAVAEFGRVSMAGIAFNLVESLPSNEACQMLSRDLPLITNVDIKQTDNANGEVFLQWLKPDIIDLDTMEHPGPYQLRLLRAEGLNGSNFTEITDARTTFNSFNNSVDTFYTDINLSTSSNGYNYRVDFYVNGDFDNIFTSSPTASSIFLSLQNIDQAINLSFQESIPWNNYQYAIFKQNSPGIFDSIGITAEQFYTDDNLINGEEYCYKIKAFGTYGIMGLPEPLINYSQEVCGIPLDTTPPCPLTIKVNNICSENPIDIDPSELINIITWNNPNINCDNTDDAIGYRIYFTPEEGGGFVLIQEINDFSQLQFDHQPDMSIAGCYAVTALDQLGNEGDLSNIICVDNCPDFLLPNTFTPNGDGANDYFGPIRSRFINKLDIKIFNRWGGLVFESSDPDFKWTGLDLSGKDMGDGTYYYTCKVYEDRVSGVVQNEEILNGFIHLFR